MLDENGSQIFFIEHPLSGNPAYAHGNYRASPNLQIVRISSGIQTDTFVSKIERFLSLLYVWTKNLE